MRLEGLGRFVLASIACMAVVDFLRTGQWIGFGLLLAVFYVHRRMAQLSEEADTNRRMLKELWDDLRRSQDARFK